MSLFPRAEPGRLAVNVFSSTRIPRFVLQHPLLIERVLDPSLCCKPIDAGGGVVLAASYEAGAFGIRGRGCDRGIESI
jgi:hypothetical protein